MIFTELQQQFTGTLITPDDAGYKVKRNAFMHSGSPKLIAMAQTAEDIATALRYAQNAGLKMSIRSGGHANTGLSTNDGGIIIDVSRIHDIELVDKKTNRVRIGAGAQWGDIAKQLYAWGLAISSGDTKSVGASGLMLGGGIGWLVRQCGLALDSLVSAQIVTADGTVLTVDENTNTDLFWAIRGGGGNFGVVVSMECIAESVTDVFYGSITYDIAEAATVLRGWRDYMRIAPQALTTSFLLLPANLMGEHPAMCMIDCCWANTQEPEMQAGIEPLRSIGTVIDENITRKPYYEVLEDAHPPQGVRAETNNAIFNELTDATIEKILHACKEGSHSLAQIRSLSGKMNQVPVEATAFAHRDAEVMVLMPTFIPEGTTESEVEVCLQPWRTIAQDANGAYVNFFSQVTSRERAAAYPHATYERLAEIKACYDPKNIFDHNLNIIPRKIS